VPLIDARAAPILAKARPHPAADEETHMDDASPRGPARHANGRFGPGNSGRPRGARSRMSSKVALGLLQHYAEHEAEILKRLNQFHFSDYMRLIGRMLPQGPGEDDDDEPE
jgi:hypothetical protein